MKPELDTEGWKAWILYWVINSVWKAGTCHWPPSPHSWQGCMLPAARFQEDEGSQCTAEVHKGFMNEGYEICRFMRSLLILEIYSMMNTYRRILQGDKSCQPWENCLVPAHHYFALFLFLPEIRFTSLASSHPCPPNRNNTKRIQRNDSQETKLILFTLLIKSNNILHKTHNMKKIWIISVIRNKTQ